MAGFDWDKQEDAPKEFNWDAQEDVDKPGVLASGVNHFINSATGGFSDELVGAGEAAGRALGLEGVGSRPPSEISRSKEGPTLDWETLRDAYRMARDKDRANLKKEEKYNPGSSMAGEVGGMVASPLNKVGEGLSAAKQFAALGGINALGNTEKEDLPGMAVDTGLGTAAGLVLGKTTDVASPYIEKGIEKLSGGARDLAERAAARALGAERGSIKRLGMDKVQNAGAQALDNGVLSPLANTEDLLSRNRALKEKGGDMMGQVYNAIDDAGASTFHPHDVAAKVEDELAPTWRTPINKGETNQFDNTIESILSRGDGDIPLSEAQKLKEELGSAANWRNKLNVSPKEQMARDAYGIVNKSIDEAVANGGQAIEAAGLNDVLKQGKQLYGNASTAEDLLSNKQAREQGNKIMGLTDAITGVGALGYGGATGDWKGAGGLVLAKKGLEKYGPQNAALALNKVSKLLMKSPKMASLAQRSPQVFNAIAQKMEGAIGGLPKAAETEQKPYDSNVVLEKAQGTKYAGVLQNAAKRGTQALGATHFILQSTDPDYRKSIEDQDQKDDPFQEN